VSIVRRRRGRKLTKTLVALVAGSVCGALWMLLVDTVANAIRPDTINDSAVLLVGAVTALVAALFLSAPQSLTEVEGLSMIVIGFHSLALPISALISFLVAGGAWLPGASAELRTVGLRRRIARGRTLGLPRGPGSQSSPNESSPASLIRACRHAPGDQARGWRCPRPSRRLSAVLRQPIGHNGRSRGRASRALGLTQDHSSPVSMRLPPMPGRSGC
jgi:hypothetical protein